VSAGGSSEGGDRAQRAVGGSVWVRPLGTPVPLGLFGLAAASLVASGLELGWIPAGQRQMVGVALVAFPVALQLIAAVLCFLSRDAAAGSGLGVLAMSWLTIGAVFVISAPGSTSGALGLLLLGSSAALLLSGAAGLVTKILPAAVLLLSGGRFAVTGVYELTRIEPWQDVAGAIGLGLTALALYAAFALQLEDARGEPVFPLLHRGAGRRAIEGSLESQFDGIENEAGVRKVL
jgi:uncharacterized protein